MLITQRPTGYTLASRGFMDHDETVRQFEKILVREAGRAQETAVELEAIVPRLTENARQLARLQVKTSHKQSRDFRAVAKQLKAS